MPTPAAITARTAPAIATMPMPRTSACRKSFSAFGWLGLLVPAPDPVLPDDRLRDQHQEQQHRGPPALADRELGPVPRHDLGQLTEVGHGLPLGVLPRPDRRPRRPRSRRSGGHAPRPAGPPSGDADRRATCSARPGTRRPACGCLPAGHASQVWGPAGSDHVRGPTESPLTLACPAALRRCRRMKKPM